MKICVKRVKLENWGILSDECRVTKIKLDDHGGLVRILVLASFGFIHCFLLATSETNKEIEIFVLYFTQKRKKKNSNI